MNNRAGELLALIIRDTISEWFEKRKLRRKLRAGLGHDVDDAELISMTAWMRIPSDRSKAPPEEK